jgi:multiple antibiotic resistance protein
MNFNFSIQEIASVSLTLFAVIDILGSIPLIINIKAKAGQIESEKATLAAGLIMFVFLFLGDNILRLFGIDLSSFAIAGAIILFLLGMEMLLGIHIFKSSTTSNSMSIVPLAFPIIAGAGTMTTLSSLRTAYELPNIMIGILVNLLFVYVVLKNTQWIENKLGEGGIEVLRKIFGMILVAIAIKLFKDNFLVIVKTFHESM